MDHCSAPLSPRTPQPDPTGIPIGRLFTSDHSSSRLVLLVSLLELEARVAMVAARAWIAMEEGGQDLQVIQDLQDPQDLQDLQDPQLEN